MSGTHEAVDVSLVKYCFLKRLVDLILYIQVFLCAKPLIW